MREVQGEEQSASCQPQLSHFRNRTVTISNTISSLTIPSPIWFHRWRFSVLVHRWGDLRRAISSGGAARSVPAVHAHSGDQATAAAGSGACFSARLPSSAVTKRKCAALNELVLLPQLWIPLASHGSLSALVHTVSLWLALSWPQNLDPAQVDTAFL